MDEQELQQPVGGLGSQAPAPIEAPMEPEAAAAPKVTAIAPPAKTSEASQLDKSLDDYQKQKILLNQQMQKMIDSYSERQQNQLFDPKMMAFAQGVLTPGKTGSFFESLGTGLGGYKDAAALEQQQAKENAKMRLDLMSSGVTLQEKQLTQDLYGKLYKEDKDGNLVVDTEIAKKLARLTSDPKIQQLAQAEQVKEYEAKKFDLVFPKKTIIDANGQEKTTLEFNAAAIPEFIKKSSNKLEAANKIAETVKTMRSQGILGDSGQNGTAFDSLVLLASDFPVIQQRAKHLADLQKSGRLTEEQAEKESSKLTELYSKQLESRNGRQAAQATTALLTSLKIDQMNQAKEQKKAEKIAAVSSTLGNINAMADQVEYVSEHPGRISGGVGAAKSVLNPQESYDYYSAVQTLKSKAFLAQVGQMKGMGALSNAEGQKIQSALANLSVVQSKEEFDKNLNDIKTSLREASERQAKLAGAYGIDRSDLGVTVYGDKSKTDTGAGDISAKATSAFGAYEPKVYDYRVAADGTVQRKKK